MRRLCHGGRHRLRVLTSLRLGLSLLISYHDLLPLAFKLAADALRIQIAILLEHVGTYLYVLLYYLVQVILKVLSNDLPLLLARLLYPLELPTVVQQVLSGTVTIAACPFAFLLQLDWGFRLQSV